MKVLRKLRLLLPTIIKLGLTNVAYIFWYRWSTKTRLRKVWFPTGPFLEESDFFTPSNKNLEYPKAWKAPLLEDAKKILNGQLRYYAHHWKPVGNPPDWFLNPFNGARFSQVDTHWITIKDFDEQVGDIKNIWEASRFEWVITLARAYMLTRNELYLSTLNAYLKDWTARNPLNIGPNWKCGQEASIRVFCLLNAAYFLGQHLSPSSALLETVKHHLERIAPNIKYAVSQKNNHATSEAAALFIGGTWLAQNSNDNKDFGNHFAQKGRKVLEQQIDHLVESNGSFSQHSTNYHRVVLDTLCFVEFWRIELQSSKFSSRMYSKCRALIDWLSNLTDEDSGDTPNLGGNDGALLNHYHSCSFRDFRPSIQLATVLFKGGICFNLNEKWNEPLLWFNLFSNQLKFEAVKKKTKVLDDSYAVIQSARSWAMMRLPQFRFRPSHNDVFHFDLWYEGENVLFDSGSYSYNPGVIKPKLDLKSIHAHNSLSFNGKEQMPRISRFLLGAWLSLSEDWRLEQNGISSGFFSASTRHYSGDKHTRQIEWSEDKWIIRDYCEGHSSDVTIGFNFLSDDYHFQSNKASLSLPWGSIKVEGAKSMEIVPHYYSLFYWDLKTCNRLVIHGLNNETFETNIKLNH